MKKLNPLFEVLEIPIYLLIIGILTFKTSTFLAVSLVLISLFRLFINMLNK
jgi:hypothetical protein